MLSSYAYCLYKFFQLLGYDDFLDAFTLLKGRDKLAKQDDIFRKYACSLFFASALLVCGNRERDARVFTILECRSR